MNELRTYLRGFLSRITRNRGLMCYVSISGCDTQDNYMWSWGYTPIIIEWYSLVIDFWIHDGLFTMRKSKRCKLQRTWGTLRTTKNVLQNSHLYWCLTLVCYNNKYLSILKFPRIAKSFRCSSRCRGTNALACEHFTPVLLHPGIFEFYVDEQLSKNACGFFRSSPGHEAPGEFTRLLGTSRKARWRLFLLSASDEREGGGEFALGVYSGCGFIVDFTDNGHRFVLYPPANRADPILGEQIWCHRNTTLSEVICYIVDRWSNLSRPLSEAA